MKRMKQVTLPTKTNPATREKKAYIVSKHPGQKSKTNPSNVYDKPKPKAVMPRLQQ
jgi:hypothetical protein